MTEFEGVVSVLKPPGMSSSDAVTDIRRLFGEKRVGHTGTLDPAAAGVLPICLGRATRLFDFLVDKQKEYIAELVFGKATDTEDATGEVTKEAECSVREEDLKSVLLRFIGETEQTPPAYSALNVNGVKLYKLARKGELPESMEQKKRLITIYELELLKKTGENRFLVRIVCSKGTYIRTLCKDIGLALGLPAYMGFLLRTRSGSFTVENSYTIAELSEMREKGGLQNAVLPMDKAVSHIPELSLSAISAKRKQLLLHGAGIPFSGMEKTPYRVYLDGEFLGLGEIRKGELRITVWLGDDSYQIKGMKITGVVTGNKHIGARLGFPTANITGYDKKQLPSEGVYASVAELEGKKYPSVTSIGRNPTFGSNELTVETYMIGYDESCYGKKLNVRFVEKLRGMQRFSSAEELKSQIERDVCSAKKLLEGSKYTE